MRFIARRYSKAEHLHAVVIKEAERGTVGREIKNMTILGIIPFGHLQCASHLLLVPGDAPLGINVSSERAMPSGASPNIFAGVMDQQDGGTDYRSDQFGVFDSTGH